MKDLTPSQEEFYEDLSQLAAAEGQFPTYQQIKDAMGFRSPNSVYQYFKSLIRKGYLEKGPSGYRFTGKAPGPVFSHEVLVDSISLMEPDEMRKLALICIDRLSEQTDPESDEEMVIATEALQEIAQHASKQMMDLMVERPLRLESEAEALEWSEEAA